ncbi:MAG TPA: DUF2007 domain-containing protein [Candidatus Brocadiia bacterium]|nr:DUF2007 domain-containing protein [Candidatus Brocadiia bacterium]
MSADRTEHPFFCPKCRDEAERPEPGKCEVCGMRLVPSGYCPKCKGFWRKRVGEECPDHGVVLESWSAAEADELDDEARAVDPGLDPVVIYESDPVTCALLRGALEDAGVEAEVDESATDMADRMYKYSRGGAAKVMVSRKDVERAEAVVADFEAGRPEEGDTKGEE